MFKANLLILLVVALVSTAQVENDDGFGDMMKELVDSIQKNATLSEIFATHFKDYSKLDSQPSMQPFTCKSGRGKRTNPTSVHALTPADIDVVAAIGDSISAAFGAKARNVVELLLEWRGSSWSIGGDGSLEQGTITLPNIIKKFNPKVTGFSTGIIPVLTMDIFKDRSKFNVAVSGAKAKNIKSQAEMLVKRMKADKTVNFDKDWKLVTLFIGGNDLCAFCKDSAQYNFNNYQRDIQATLDYLQRNLPRTFVNLVMILDVTQLSEVNNGLACNLLHRVVCKCASMPASAVAKDAMILESVEYSETILDLLSSGAYDQEDDFTVVAQPFFVNQRLPANKNGKPDLGYFAPDCFHFSAKGHAASAQALWNNMFEPAGRKRLSWFRDERWHCPTDENPYLSTYQNSFQPQRKNKQLGQQNRQPLEREPELKERAAQQGVNNSVTSATTPAILGTVIGVAVCVMIVMAIVVQKKRKSREENTPLLN